MEANLTEFIVCQIVVAVVAMSRLEMTDLEKEVTGMTEGPQCYLAQFSSVGTMILNPIASTTFFGAFGCAVAATIAAFACCNFLWCISKHLRFGKCRSVSSPETNTPTNIANAFDAKKAKAVFKLLAESTALLFACGSYIIIMAFPFSTRNQSLWVKWAFGVGTILAFGYSLCRKFRNFVRLCVASLQCSVGVYCLYMAALIMFTKIFYTPVVSVFGVLHLLGTSKSTWLIEMNLSAVFLSNGSLQILTVLGFLPAATLVFHTLFVRLAFDPIGLRSRLQLAWVKWIMLLIHIVCSSALIFAVILSLSVQMAKVSCVFHLQLADVLLVQVCFFILWNLLSRSSEMEVRRHCKIMQQITDAEEPCSNILTLK